MATQPRMITAMDEAELSAGCRHGDRDAQRELHERFVERIYRLALRLSGNPQDAFVCVFERFAALQALVAELAPPPPA